MLLTMEKHLSAPDCLALGLFDGPHILSHMLLESFTLSDIRQTMKEKTAHKGKYLMQEIQINIKQVKMRIKDGNISNNILSRLKKSTQFFSIMESLIVIGSIENQNKILNLLMYIGENDYFRNLISEKLQKINLSPDLLLSKDNPNQTLLHLHYSKLVFLVN